MEKETRLFEQGKVYRLIYGSIETVCQIPFKQIDEIKAVYAGLSEDSTNRKIHEFVYRDLNYPEIILVAKIHSCYVDNDKIILKDAENIDIDPYLPKLQRGDKLEKRSGLIKLLEEAGL